MTEDSRFDISRESNQLVIDFSSTMKNIDRAVETTKIFLKDIGYESLTFDVSLVLREGLTNAVKHGNRLDADKAVKYSIQLFNDRLIVEIEDEGDGFDYKAMRDELLDVFLSESDLQQIDDHEEGAEWRPDQKISTRPKSEHGRGIIILEEYFDDYIYSDKGNKLVLIKEL